MVSFAQLKDMDTSKLSAAAASAGDFSGAMSSRASQVNSSAEIPPGMWQGHDADSASKLLQPLDSPLFDVSDSADHSQAVLEELAEDLDKAKEDLNDAVSAARAHGLIVGEDGSVHVPQTEDPLDALRKAKIARQVSENIEDAIRRAKEADEKAGGSLAAGDVMRAQLEPTGGTFPEVAKWLGDKTNTGLTWLGRANTIAGDYIKSPKGRSTLKSIGKKTGPVGAVLSGVISAYDQAEHDNKYNSDKPLGERAFRAFGRGVLEGGGGFIGGTFGAAAGGPLGAVAGGAIGGAPGAAVGGVGGTLLGGYLGGKGGTAVGEWGADQLFGDIPEPHKVGGGGGGGGGGSR